MASTHHHFALRVADVERASKFYEEAFGATRPVPPFELEGELAEMSIGGPPGVAVRIQMLSLEHGALELYEFTQPRNPPSSIHPTEGNILHFAMQVDDTAAALERVEAAGGKRAWDEILEMGDTLKIIYVTDPDGNSIELINGSIDELLDLIRAQFG